MSANIVAWQQLEGRRFDQVVSGQGLGLEPTHDQLASTTGSLCS